MKRAMVLLVLVLCMGLFQVGFGQTPEFGVGGVLGFPTGDFSNIASSPSFGGTVQLLFPVEENVAIGGQVGYITFGGENYALRTYSIRAIPILAEGRYYLGVSDGILPFIGALVGLHIMRIDYSGTNFIFSDGGLFPRLETQDYEGDDNSTELSIAPMGGLQIGQLDISAFYMLISDANYFGARIGFNF